MTKHNKYMVFDYNPTIRVIFGKDSLNRIGELATELKAKRVLLVTDPGIVQAGHVKRASDLLRQAGIDVFVFSDVVENPTTMTVDAGVRFARECEQLDLIIGLGGGSAMDCAKGINFLLTNDGQMQDYWGVGKAKKPMLPAIGVPTTAGTGSEAQSFALISDAKTHQKMACGDVKARFRAVILDPVLVQTAPKQVRAVTGMDAMSHAIESFVCTKSNAFSRMFAKEAWRRLSANYATVVQDSDDLEVLESMMIGAHLAGAAIESSMLGAAHACANPLTARYGIIHGKAVGLMLPHVVRFNGHEVNGDYDELLQLSGWREKEGSGAAGLAEGLHELFRANGWSDRLRDYHVDKQRLNELASEAASQWTGGFNPRQVSKDEFLQLYQEAF